MEATQVPAAASAATSAATAEERAPAMEGEAQARLAATQDPPTPTLRPTRLRPGLLALAAAGLAGAALLGILVGPVGLSPAAVAWELVGRLPFVHVDSGLSAREAAILWELRVPRVVLGGLVGAMLAVAGAAYQGVFRNPLADPYLLGVAAGAGLGATLAVAYLPFRDGWPTSPIPLAAFAGALMAVVATYGLGRSGTRSRTTATLILAGVAVASFFTAVQTYVQQQHAETLREVYAWILGGLGTVGWQQVVLILPYVGVSALALLLHGRLLDVLALGDDEAESLGVPATRVRLAVVGAATLGTAAAVAVSGLIGFVGIIVPHAIRLALGSSYRIILPLSAIFGAAFLILADLLARTALAPAEIPIGVITAFVGAPFFLVVLRRTRKIG
jgi:iron complex transport system permease protein